MLVQRSLADQKSGLLLDDGVSGSYPVHSRSLREFSPDYEKRRWLRRSTWLVCRQAGEVTENGVIGDRPIPACGDDRCGESVGPLIDIRGSAEFVFEPVIIGTR